MNHDPGDYVILVDAFVGSFQGPVTKSEHFIAGFVRPTPAGAEDR